MIDEIQLERRLTTLENGQQMNTDQIIDILEKQSDTHKLTLSVHDLAGAVKRLVEDMCKMNNRVENLESKPGRMWDNLVGYVIAAIVSGVVGYAIAIIVR